MTEMQLPSIASFMLTKRFAFTPHAPSRLNDLITNRIDKGE